MTTPILNNPNRILAYHEVRKSFPRQNDEPLPSPGEMFILYDEQSIPKCCEYLCPCGCGNMVYTPVDPVGQPKKSHRWHIRYDPDGITLIPSIRWTGACYGHFNITGGRSVFHDDCNVKPK